MLRLCGILAMAMAIGAGTAAASEPAGPVTIAFQATGPTLDQPGTGAAGLFSMAGPVSLTGPFAPAGAGPPPHPRARRPRRGRRAGVGGPRGLQARPPGPPRPRR